MRTKKLEPNELMLLIKQNLPHTSSSAELQKVPSITLQTELLCWEYDGNAIFYPASDADLTETTALTSANPIDLGKIIKEFMDRKETLESVFGKTINKLYFPITEERNNRHHFVLLEIDLEKNKALLVDSKKPTGMSFFGCCRCGGYSINHIAEITQQYFNLALSTDYTGSQSTFDDHSCGYQVAARILLAINGQKINNAAIGSKVKQLQAEKIQADFDSTLPTTNETDVGNGWNEVEVVELDSSEHTLGLGSR